MRYHENCQRYGGAAYCLKRWPLLLDFLPNTAVRLVRGFGQSDGMCTHPEAADEAFVHSKGARQFVPSATVPDGFFWSGTQNRGTSEYPFAMWRTGERRFWFYVQRCLIIADSHAKTREDELLLEALLRWDAGEAIVAYSGFVGWYEITREKSES